MSAGLPGEPSSAEPARPVGPLFYIGAVGLLTAMAVEVIAVLGRQIGTPLLGALEVIQTAILLTSSAAMLSATLTDAHATVHLVTDRLSPRPRLFLRRLANFLSAVFFTGLAAGALWLTLDFWNANEQSELLHISYRPLRIISFVAVAGIVALFVRNLFRRGAGQATP